MNTIMYISIIMIKIGLNGFGRIGRSITRIVSNAKDIKLVVVNEINQDIENLAYSNQI